MPLRNRVSPEGFIEAVAERGTMYGNRGGCFHRADQTLMPRQFATKQWICCVLQFKGRRRRLMQPGRFTELFFLDEATAWAAGHRPCFECRRDDAVRFAETWNRIDGATGRAAAPTMDAQLHGERIDGQGRKVSFRAPFRDAPDGALVRMRGAPGLVMDGRWLSWSFGGYGAAREVPAGEIVDVLTPRRMIALMRAGLRPAVHASAKSLGSVIE